MATLSTLVCLPIGANTGVETCAFDPKKIIGAILTPKNYIISAANLTTLQTQLNNDIQQSNLGKRILPIFGFQISQDKSEDIIVQTMGYGGKYVVREGFNDWNFEYVEGGATLLSNLRKSNGNSRDFLFIDDQNNIIGTAGTDATGAACLKAIPCTGGFFWAHPWKANDGSKITQYTLQFVFSPKFVNDYLAFVAAGYDLASTHKGLVNVNVTSPSANATSGVYNLQVKTAGVGTDLSAIYPVELANILNWVATNTQTGLSIPVTAVAYNAAIPGFNVTLNNASPNYPVTALAAPVANAPTTATTGGTLAAGTYYYKITAINANGETIASNEVSQVTTGATSTVTITWAAITGATGYKIYRGTTAGAENVYYSVGTVTTFTDTGAANTAGTPPATNTTGTGTTVTIGLATPSTLATNSVVGYESNTVAITKN